jgi:hypothetical protein
MENLWEERIRAFRHPSVNPVYRITGQSGKWELKRNAGPYYVKSIASDDQVCLPETCAVTARSVDPIGLAELQRADASEFARLVRSLVIIDLPQRFMQQSDRLEQSGDMVQQRRQAVM